LNPQRRYFSTARKVANHGRIKAISYRLGQLILSSVERFNPIKPKAVALEWHLVAPLDDEGGSVKKS